jgi:hypothetical protein
MKLFAPVLCLTAMLVAAVPPCFGSSITISYHTAAGCSGSSSGPTYSTSCTSGGVTTAVAADASLDVLKLSLDSEGTFQPSLQHSSAEIRIMDTFTVTGGSGNGTLVWNWDFDGTLDANPGFFSSIYMSNLGHSEFAYYSTAQSHETVDATRSISIPFVFGTALSVDWRLTAVIGELCANFNNCNVPLTGGGTVDFFDTLRLQPLVVLNSSGTQVGGASALSTSGFSYVVAPTASAVPEPASLLLLASGLTNIGARRWRQGNAKARQTYDRRLMTGD